MKKRRTTPRPGPIDKHRPPRLPHFELASAVSCRPDDIVRDEHDQVGKIVVSLAVVFNDLKGLVMSNVFLKDARKLAASQEANGQIDGLIIQTARWTFGLIHELLDLVRDKGETIDSTEFRELLSTLEAEAAMSWQSIEAVARRGEGGDTQLRGALARCRNSVAFHYADKRSRYWRGLIDAFDGKAGRAGLGPPALSDGADMEASRFYFADAAARQLVEPLTKTSFDEMAAQASELGRQANLAIKPIVVAHVRRRAGELPPYTRPTEQRSAEE